LVVNVSLVQYQYDTIVAASTTNMTEFLSIINHRLENSKVVMMQRGSALMTISMFSHKWRLAYDVRAWSIAKHHVIFSRHGHLDRMKSRYEIAPDLEHKFVIYIKTCCLNRDHITRCCLNCDGWNICTTTPQEDENAWQVGVNHFVITADNGCHRLGRVFETTLSSETHKRKQARRMAFMLCIHARGFVTLCTDLKRRVFLEAECMSKKTVQSGRRDGDCARCHVTAVMAQLDTIIAKFSHA
jgi:hypothetical protein